MFYAIIAMIMGHIRYKRLLKKCLVENPQENQEVFEYKEQFYDRQYFIALRVLSLERMRKKNLDKMIVEEMNNSSKWPGLDEAELTALKTTLEKRESRKRF